MWSRNQERLFAQICITNIKTVVRFAVQLCLWTFCPCLLQPFRHLGSISFLLRSCQEPSSWASLNASRWKRAGVWRQLKYFFLQAVRVCSFLVYGCSCSFYFPFRFCQAVSLSSWGVFCFWLQECAKWGNLVDYCLESKFSHIVIDGVGTHICKILCSIKGTSTYITVSSGLSRGSEKKK